MQDNPYEDQKTVITPHSSEAPTLYIEKEASPHEEAVQPKMIPLAAIQQKKKFAFKKILLGGAIILALFILGAAGALFVPKLIAGTNSQAVASTPAANAASKNVYTPYLAQYRTNIRDQIAQGLHLSTDQLEAQLNAGKTLSEIAVTQGVSASQLQTIVTNAFQSSFQPTVNSGNLTQKQVDTLVKRMLKQPKTLDRFLVVRTKKNTGATAVAQ